MMRVVCFDTDLFEGGASRERSDKALSYYLWLLYKLNLDYLAEHTEAPGLYESGVRYRRENPAMPEKWQTIPLVLQRGYGDCEDLSCWLAAQMTSRGHEATPYFTFKVLPGDRRLYHIRVKDSRGKEYDPSKRLGM